jgi:hypothetical protein
VLVCVCAGVCVCVSISASVSVSVGCFSVGGFSVPCLLLGTRHNTHFFLLVSPLSLHFCEIALCSFLLFFIFKLCCYRQQAQLGSLAVLQLGSCLLDGSAVAGNGDASVTTTSSSSKKKVWLPKLTSLDLSGTQSSPQVQRNASLPRRKRVAFQNKRSLFTKSHRRPRRRSPPRNLEPPPPNRYYR